LLPGLAKQDKAQRCARFVPEGVGSDGRIDRTPDGGLQMSHVDGLQAARQLRRRPELATTPIVAMTADAFSEDRQACLDAGMNDHIAKPVDPPALYAALLRWLPE
jgi:DNA-binding NarL/FixJ family response regulator